MGTSILDLTHVWLSVIAGGQGTRLFPYSHPERPKQFCQLNRDDKFIQAAIRNFVTQGIKKTQVTIATTNAQQTALAKEQVVSRGILSQNINEISPDYGYAGAMVEMTKIIYEIDPEAVIINTPSDQYIIPDEDFSKTIYDAINEAEKGNFVIVGVKVNDLDTAMGCGHALYEEAQEQAGCFKVEGFIEKPSRETANQIMRAGNSACNTGINVWKAKTLLDTIGDFDVTGLATDALMKILQPNLEIAVGNFEWRDCGTLKSLYEISKKTPNHRNASFGGGEIDRFECLDGLFLCDEGYRLHVAGSVDDAVIVSTIDSRPIVAVINKNESARVKKLAEDYARNQDLLTNDFSILAHNNLVMRSNISKETITCFVCVENYIVNTYRAADGMVDVFVSKQIAPV